VNGTETSDLGSTSRGAPPEICSLFSPLVGLHRRVASTALPEYPAPPDWVTITNVISSATNTDMADEIVDCLQHLQDAHNPIVSVRAWVIYSFSDQDESWPVVEWKDGIDTSALAIFDFDDDGFCSYVMYYSSKENGCGSSLGWMVSSLSCLNVLLQAAQHMLGILNWSKADAMKLYCETDASPCTKEESIPKVYADIQGWTDMRPYLFITLQRSSY
jgi:hypothetical protein